MAIRWTPEQLKALADRGLVPHHQGGARQAPAAAEHRDAPPQPQRPPRRGTPGQDALWQILRARHGTAVVRDYVGAVPGRRFEVDIAWPRWRFGVEVDGYETHGLAKGGWHRDHEKDRLLQASDWMVLRYTNRECVQETVGVLDSIEGFLTDRQAKLNNEGDN